MKCECGKEIHFLVTSNGHKMPVNEESMTAFEIADVKANLKRLYNPEHHISHFRDCPLAKKFSHISRKKEKGNEKMSTP